MVVISFNVINNEITISFYTKIVLVSAIIIVFGLVDISIAGQADAELITHIGSDPFTKDSNANTYKYDGNQFNPVKGYPLHQIAVGSDGSVWGINNAGNIYKYDGNQFNQVDDQLRQIAVGNSGNVWGLADSYITIDINPPPSPPQSGQTNDNVLQSAPPSQVGQNICKDANIVLGGPLGILAGKIIC